MSSGAAPWSLSWMTLSTSGCPVGSRASSRRSSVFDLGILVFLEGLQRLPLPLGGSTQRAVTGTITSCSRAARGP